MFYLRVVGNKTVGFYDFELFTEEQLGFDFIALDDSEEKVLTIKDKGLFSKTPQLEK